MSSLQEWFDEHPRARPLMTFAALGLVCLGIGVWLTAGQGPTKQPINRKPVVEHTSAPTLVGETPLVKRNTTVWAAVPETPIYPEPGLNNKILSKLPQWEELSWLQTIDGWDQVRLSDGSTGWVPLGKLAFAKPANLSQPSQAEATVMHFYQAVVHKDYARAYSFLGPEWKSELTFDAFVSGYSQTLSLATKMVAVVPLSKESFQVDVSMKADEMGHDVLYLGSYLVEKVSDDWYLTAGSLKQEGQSRLPQRNIRVPLVESSTPAPLVSPLPESNEDPELPPE
jgi:hypothetical protein